MRAFTLIELLVCVLIMGLLMGLIVPAIGSARDTARSVACQSNLRGLWQQTIAYAGDYREPPPEVWGVMVEPIACPAHRQNEDVATEDGGDYTFTRAGFSRLSLKANDADQTLGGDLWADSFPRHKGRLLVVGFDGKIR